MSSNWRDKNLVITKSGYLDLRHILNDEDYRQTTINFLKRKSKIEMPYPNIIPGRPCFVLLHDLTITIEDPEEYKISYTFKTGFTGDLSSVPKRAQSIVQNDDEDADLAAMVHDYNFATKYFGDSRSAFKKTNRLFKQMIYNSIRTNKRTGLFNRLKDEIYYIGVESCKGWREYKKDDNYRKFYEDFVDVELIYGEVKID